MIRRMLAPLTLLAVLVPLVGATPAVAADPPLPIHEWGMPVEGHRGEAPRGVMLVIHGGGWVSEGPDYVAQTRPTAYYYRRHGWATLNIDYRVGRGGYMDAVRFYDVARKTYPDLPICAVGQSAGGQVAGMVAVRRPGLACLVTEAGPLDMRPLAAGRTIGDISAIVGRYFPGVSAARLSPALHLRRYKGRVLAAFSSGDPIIPAADQVAAARAMGAKVLVLPGASTPVAPAGHGFVHNAVSARAYAAWDRDRLELLRTVEAERGGPR